MLKKHLLCGTGIKIFIPLLNDMAVSSKMGQGIRNPCEYSKKVVLIILFWNVLETAIAPKEQKCHGEKSHYEGRIN